MQLVHRILIGPDQPDTEVANLVQRSRPVTDFKHGQVIDAPRRNSKRRGRKATAFPSRQDYRVHCRGSRYPQTGPEIARVLQRI